MNRPSVHVCVATGQNLANLIPALQLGAQTVAILETPGMQSSAANLKAALETHGISATRMPFDDSTPEAIVRSASDAADRLGEQPLVFNATGGHKLMILALTEEMKVADELHLLYTETRYDRLDWLKPHAQVEPMEDVLKLDDILFAQGYRRLSDSERDGHWQRAAVERETLTRRLGDDADKLAKFFGTLNALADQALENEPDGPFWAHQEFDYAPGGANADVLHIAQKLNLLQWDGDSEIVFSSPETAAYFRGGWLEEYVWLKLRGLKPRDWSVNLKIETVGGKTENQLDAVVVHRNRMLAIECKTGRFGRDARKDADYIYKLAQLSRQVGGILSSSLLLSAHPVSEQVRVRAKECQVDIVAAAGIKRLVPYLRDWMNS